MIYERFFHSKFTDTLKSDGRNLWLLVGDVQTISKKKFAAYVIKTGQGRLVLGILAYKYGKCDYLPEVAKYLEAGRPVCVTGERWQVIRVYSLEVVK